jgi:hypothetical protein
MAHITRDNIDQLLDAGMIEAATTHGKWWKLRRNGETKRWKRDASRIRIPVKAGFRDTTAIDESNFINGVLDSTLYRIAAE